MTNMPRKICLDCNKDISDRKIPATQRCEECSKDRKKKLRRENQNKIKKKIKSDLGFSDRKRKQSVASMGAIVKHLLVICANYTIQELEKPKRIQEEREAMPSIETF